MSKCGGSLSSGESNVTSPGWPDENYPLDTVCVWTLINQDYGETNTQIQLDFRSFELEDDCSKDYLEIYEFDARGLNKLGRYCSKNKPPFIWTYKSGISIVFKSDKDTPRKGFMFNIKTIKSTCGGYRTSGHENYARALSPYKADQHCESILEVDPMSQLNLTFVNRFEIEDSVNCSKDYLDINEWRNNSWHHFGRYCGYNSPGSIIFKENRGQLIFHSDGDDRRGDGFDYYVTKYCQLTIDKRGNGTIESPDYPNYYGINYCEWTFKGEEPNDTIHVHFKHFDIDSEESCDGNYLELVKKSATVKGNLVRRYCSKNSPKHISSKGSLKIISMSNKASLSKGFTFDYRIIQSQ
ncbi:tolloid-like protein 2 [Panonychus citri]|uniref:tolloid-like protein 2 n=1 Tax=Panonychus citri TaxID=50023 RepID=UPI002307836E|nr:tolloid-like protein 2 [Panonychus citri]